MTTYFEAPDGHDEPTLWAVSGNRLAVPVIRRCDVPKFWPDVVARMTGTTVKCTQSLGGDPCIVQGPHDEHRTADRRHEYQAGTTITADDDTVEVVARALASSTTWPCFTAGCGANERDEEIHQGNFRHEAKAALAALTGGAT